MKIQYTEHIHDYTQYAFGYQIWAIPEKEDTLDSIYEQGFLPYSGSEFPLPSYYYCRSVRIDISTFYLNSENRRILKKFDSMFDSSMIVPASILADDPAFIDFALGYFREKHDEKLMSRERLRSICLYDESVWIRIYTDANGKNVAYIIERHGNNCMHYWFSLYDVAFSDGSFGMWLMINSVRIAMQRFLQYVYLGTAYTPSSLYKANFSSLEFWDGNHWNKDIKELKRLARM